MARVLTEKQLYKLTTTSVVWEEFWDPARQSPSSVKPMLVSRLGCLYDEDGEIPIEPGIYEPFDGGKRRRFWDARPTAAERKEAMWDD